jgi:hypothetical protein
VSAYGRALTAHGSHSSSFAVFDVARDLSWRGVACNFGRPRGRIGEFGFRHDHGVGSFCELELPAATTAPETAAPTEPRACGYAALWPSVQILFCSFCFLRASERALGQGRTGEQSSRLSRREFPSDLRAQLQRVQGRRGISDGYLFERQTQIRSWLKFPRSLSSLVS